MYVGKVDNAISKLYAGHATKNVLMNDSNEPVGYTLGLEKRQMDEAQNRNIFRHVNIVCE